MIRCYHPTDASVVSQLWLEGNLQAHFFVSPTHWHTYLPLLPEALAQAEVYVYDEGGVKGFIGYVILILRDFLLQPIPVLRVSANCCWIISRIVIPFWTYQSMYAIRLPFVFISGKALLNFAAR